VTQTTKRRPATPAQAARRPAALDRLLDPGLFKALGDPTRVRLLACLAKCGRACSVSEVAACTAVDFSVVSRHLLVLARAGVLEASREGRLVRYRVQAARLCRSLRDLAAELEGCCGRGDAAACCARSRCACR
jgi:ArsR family transcriptional regulator